MKRVLILLFILSGVTGKAQNFKELSDSLMFYYQAKNYDKAIPFAEKLVTLVKNNYSDSSKIYSTYLSFLSGLYFGSLQFSKAEEALSQLNEVNKIVFGVKSEEYIKGISMLAVVYNTTGRDDKAIPVFNEAAEYYKVVNGEESPEYASALNKLGKVYENLDMYEESASLLLKSSGILLKSKGENDPDYATAINNLGILYKNMGQPEKAEPLLLKAMGIRKKTTGIMSDDYANSLNNLAVFYEAIEQTEKATAWYSKAAEIFKISKGESSPEYITCFSNLGSAYESAGDFRNAESFYLRAQALAEKNYDENWPLRQHISYRLGQLYLYTKEYIKAEPLLMKAADTEKKKNENGDGYAAVINDLAYLYNNTARKTDAEKYYKWSAALTKKALGEKHASYASSLNNLALFYTEEGRYEDAVPLFRQVLTIESEQLIRVFSVLSEAEKINYTERNIFFQHIALNILYRFPAVSPSFYRDNFNMQLLMKSLLLTDSRNILAGIKQSKDTTVLKWVNIWRANKKRLSEQYAMPEIMRNKNLVQLEEETENAEKELTRNSAAFRNLSQGLDIKMEDVQRGLSANEAAVEFVRFRLVNNNTSDSIIYAAFVLRKNDSVPVFIPLFEERQLISLVGSTGKTSKALASMLYPARKGAGYDLSSSGIKMYKLIWEPLEPLLKNINRIAYSPAGKLYNIAFHALAADTGRLLSDKYELRQLMSTKLLAYEAKENSIEKPGSITLIGNASFSLDSLQIINLYRPVKGKKTVQPGAVKTNNINKQGYWPALPGSAEEIKNISSLFTRNNIPVKTLTGTDASEQNLKLLSNISPGVINISTHGFFLPEPDKRKNQLAPSSANVYSRSGNPLLRSGLILSGGNYVWSGKPPVEGTEDGVVTAYEISQLNLSNTKLTVLSACETGLGDVRGTEGVFGLQRAFKLAGVQKLIVSLWKVPDKETSELMILFYTHWLKGNTIRKAFDLAQSDMRKIYSPYFWAAFVLVE